MNTTTEILSVDGVILNTMAKNIESIAGRLHTPDRKGSNVAVSGAAGELYVPGKMDAPNVIALPMWVRGCDDDGIVPALGQDRINFYKNLDLLTGIFGRNTGLLDVRHTMPDNSIRQCFAEVLSAIDFSTTGRRPLGRFSVEMEVPDVYWQDLNSLVQSKGFAASGVIQTYDTFIGGTAPIYDAVVTITGPANTGMTIQDVISGEYIVINQAIPAGQQVVIDNPNWTVKLNGADIITNVAHSHDYLLPISPDNGGPRFQMTGGGFTVATAVQITGRRKYRVG